MPELSPEANNFVDLWSVQKANVRFGRGVGGGGGRGGGGGGAGVESDMLFRHYSVFHGWKNARFQPPVFHSKGDNHHGRKPRKTKRS